jgi:hypothetical protein
MGVIVYMLVSGVPPFWGASDAEVMKEKGGVGRERS